MQKNYIHYLFILVVCWFAFFVNNGSVYEDSPVIWLRRMK
mgnify:CR=1 FL=1